VNVGRYEIIRELGKGAMGVVYLARDPAIGRLVAIKTVRPTATVDEGEEEFRERFRREARSAGRLSHPSIVTIYDIDEDKENGVSFITMEFIEGRNLKEILTNDGRMAHDEVATVIAQIADALDYAHSRGVVHRDVKPANIIRTATGTAKITDFGIAKIATGDASLTAPGQFLGTPNYMAPEQIKATHKVDGRADIFALGVVIYEALTGKKPFNGDSLTSISYQIVNEPFAPLREIDSEIPAAYETIVDLCLHKSPDHRYQAAGQLAGHLRSAAKGEPLADLPPRPAEEDRTSLTVARADGRQASLPPREERFSIADDSLTMIAPDRIAPEATGTLNRRISTVKGLAIIVVLLAILGGTAWTIWSRRAEIPEIDTRRESTIAWQASLRREAAAAMERGDIDKAYEKYRELSTLAPDSPEVGRTLETIEAMRAPEESGPTKESKAGPAGTGTKQPVATTDAAPRQATTPAAEQPATLLTEFDPGLRDGTIDVFADGQPLVHENLWEERFFRRRAPRAVSVYSQVDPGTRRLEVIVTIPSQGIVATRTVRPTMRAGALTRIVVTLDAGAGTIRVDVS